MEKRFLIIITCVYTKIDLKVPFVVIKKGHNHKTYFHKRARRRYENLLQGCRRRDLHISRNKIYRETFHSCANQPDRAKSPKTWISTIIANAGSYCIYGLQLENVLNLDKKISLSLNQHQQIFDGVSVVGLLCEATKKICSSKCFVWHWKFWPNF